MESPQREDVESWRNHPWSKLPPWGKRTVGVLGAILLIGIGAALGGSEEDDLKDELEQAESALTTANAERDQAQARADTIISRRDQIIGNARSERSRLSGKLENLQSKVDATKAELQETESSLAGAEREEALSSFGDGIWQADVDFTPGTYRSEGGDGCYYATLGSADTNDILTNEITLDASQQIVTIDSPYFQSKGCGTWERVE